MTNLTRQRKMRRPKFALNCLSGDFNRMNDFVKHRIRSYAFYLRFGSQKDTMTQRGMHNIANVIRSHEIEASHCRQRFARKQHGDGSARARPPKQVRMFTCSTDEIDQVVLHAGFNSRLAHQGSTLRDYPRISYQIEVHSLQLFRVETRLPVRDHLEFFIETRIGDQNLEHKPVELGFRQGVGAFIFDRVFSSKHQKKWREVVSLAIDRHLAFFHGLEQSGLRFWGRAVDLVCEQNVGENRAVAKRKLCGAWIENVGSSDVGRHQIGRELDAIESRAYNARHRFDHQSLCCPRHAFNQGVPFGKQADQDLINDRFLADDYFLRFALDVRGDLADILSHGNRWLISFLCIDKNFNIGRTIQKN